MFRALALPLCQCHHEHGEVNGVELRERSSRGLCAGRPGASSPRGRRPVRRVSRNSRDVIVRLAIRPSVHLRPLRRPVPQWHTCYIMTTKTMVLWRERARSWHHSKWVGTQVVNSSEEARNAQYLRVGLRIPADEFRWQIIRQLASQPLLPSWRLEIVSATSPDGTELVHVNVTTPLQLKLDMREVE